MLTESQVIAAVCNFLERNGFIIVSRCSETQRGYDIVAVHPADQREVRIEAKGETSSKPWTKRYGFPFSQSQVFDHVAKAAYCAAGYISAGVHSGIALPKNDDHLGQVQFIEAALRKLQIEVFWVTPDGVTEHSNHWSTWK